MSYTRCSASCWCQWSRANGGRAQRRKPFPPGPVGAFAAHRGVERAAAAVCPAAPLVTITLRAQAAADAGAQHPLAHLGLQLEKSGRIQPAGFMKHHARRRVCGVGRLEEPIDDAAVKV